MKLSFPLHVHISTLFLILILLVGGLIGGVGYHLSREMLERTTDDLVARIGRETANELEAILAPAEMAIKLLGHDPLNDARRHGARMSRIDVLKETLSNSPALSSVYFGYDNGDFFFMRRVRDEDERQRMGAPKGTRYMVQSIERGARATVGRYVYLDGILQVLGSDDRPAYAAGYDPRARDWYLAARKSASSIQTAPYLFFSNRKVGLTLATRGENGRNVVGADILLETLGRGLADRKVTSGTQIALVNQAGEVIAHEAVDRLVTVTEGADARPKLKHLAEFGIPILAGVADDFNAIGERAHLSLRRSFGDGDWHVDIGRMPVQGAPPLYLVVAIPDGELLAAALRMRDSTTLITILIILVAIPLTWLLAHRVAGPLRGLVGEADAIRHFDFSRPIAVRSRVREVDDLARTMDGMKRTIRRFLDLSQAVAAEGNFDRLLPMLLQETLLAADASAGALYLVDAEALVSAVARRQNGEIFAGALPPVSFADASTLLGGAIAAGAPRVGRLGEREMAALGLDGLMTAPGERHGVAVPLLNRQQQLVGAMLLLRDSAIEDAQVSFVKALSGAAASSLETRELIKAQKELFEAFIQLIASAIDAKSPYTGGHCARVPELTKMLARAACAETGGPLSDFQLSEQDWEAVHVAAWLHDCGKVTTPEYVVDKSTKLETLHDRIHEIRMRFEVLKRDARIVYLEAIAAGEPADAARARLEAELRALDDEFAFVAGCNEGGEFMAPEKLERLKAIAARTWQRTLDDRIGISHEELARKQRVAAQPMPVTEPLLADKPEHVFERRPQDRMAEDNRWGFRMDVPELLYNKGELHNLAVSRGTLSEEERYKINEHIVQTLIMLSQLPFPKHLRQVPEIAGGHHETMDGSGYPKRLTREQMSPMARMMAIADIFEALTAVDRPYKKGKTLSEAIRIMSFMRRDQHIDADLFALFLSSGVYREYADRFMRPEQIDEVDVASFLKAA